MNHNMREKSEYDTSVQFDRGVSELAVSLYKLKCSGEVAPYDSCAIPPIEMIRGAMATEAIINPASPTVLFVDSSLTIMEAPTIRMVQNTQRKTQPKRPCCPCLKRQ